MNPTVRSLVALGVLSLVGCSSDTNEAVDVPASSGCHIILNQSECPNINAGVSPAALFFYRQQLATTSGKIMEPPSSIGRMSIELLSRYEPIHPDATMDGIPYSISVALRKMYLRATTHEDDGGWRFILDRMRNNPDVPYWANCGSSVDLMVVLLASFGVDARIISIWHSLTDGHVILEYYSSNFRKYVYYDPLYGVYMVNAGGSPASVDDILMQINIYGADSTKWDYQPVRIYDLFSDSYVPAASAEYEYYNSLDYHVILDNYFKIVAVRSDDLTSFVYLNLGTQLGQSIERGSWHVYRFVSDDEWGPIKEEMLNQFDASRGGRYVLNFEDGSD